MNLFAMTKEQYEGYLQSKKWRALRLCVLKRDKYSCTKCGGKYNLQVHHVTYERIGEELASDLQTLCRKCHESEHKGELLIKLIELCCKRFLSQRPNEDYNPATIPRCHGCDYRFDDYKEIRYKYGTNAFGGAGVYCENCILGVRAALLKSKVPHYVNFIEVDYREELEVISHD